MAHAPENTLEAFRRALRLGAAGLESDAWLTADGEVVLHHHGEVRTGLRRRPIADVSRSGLPSHVPTLGELYGSCGTAFELSLDVRDPSVAPAVVAVARQAGGGALGRLWLCAPDLGGAAWRSLSDDVHLVESTRLRAIREGPERRAAALADAGIDAINLRFSDWTGGLTTLFHRFGRYAFGWDAQHPRQLDHLLGMGIDAVYSDHVDRMVAALAARHGPD